MRDRGESPAPAATAPEPDATRWAVPGVDPGGDDTVVQRPVSVETGEQARASVLAGLRCASPQISTLADAVAGLVDQGSFGELGTAAQLNDDVIGLARVTQVLAAETARRVHAADMHDVTTTGVRATLAGQGWSGKATWASLHAGGFCARYPQLVGLWRAGTITDQAIATIAHQVRGLPASDADAVVAWLLPLLPVFDDAQVKVAVTAAVDRLRPDDAEARQREAYDGRYLTSTRFQQQVMIEAKLPALEGEAFLAAVAAWAEKLRTEGDGLTRGQRAADALAAMMAALAADGKTPTHNGHPASATVLIPLSEAERITNGIVRRRQQLPDCTGLFGDPPFDKLRDRREALGDQSGQAFTRLPLSTGRIGAHHTLGDAAARFLLCAAEVTGAVVTTGHNPHPSPGRMLAAFLGAAPLQPLALGRAQRFATAAQRKALEIRDGGCVIEGCGIEPRHCQTHHQPGWAEGGTTDLDQMALLCWPHHRQLDHGKWILKRNPDPGGRHWITEPQPRHRWRT